MAAYLKLNGGNILIIGHIEEYSPEEFVTLITQKNNRIAEINTAISLLHEEPIPEGASQAVVEALATWNHDHYTVPLNQLLEEKAILESQVTELEAVING